MKVIKKWLTVVTVYTLCAVSTFTAYADVDNGDGGGMQGPQSDAAAAQTPPSTPPANMESFNVSTYLKAEGQAAHTNIAVLLVKFINQLSLVIGSFALLTIIVGAMSLLTSAGREQPLTRGKDMIKFAIIGLIVAFGAYFITAFVQSIFYDV